MVLVEHKASEHVAIHVNGVSVIVFLNFFVFLLLTYLMLGLMNQLTSHRADRCRGFFHLERLNLHVF